MADWGVVEIRTHGVSGASAEAILETPRVAIHDPGFPTGRGSFGVPSSAEETTVNGRTHWRYSYRWGDMTAGLGHQALWAVLAPFALINVASWMVPQVDWNSKSSRFAGALHRSLFRLLGLAFTALLMTQLTFLVADLLLTQCPVLREAGGGDLCWNWVATQWNGHWDTAARSWAVFGVIAVVILLGAILALTLDNDDDLRGAEPPGREAPEPPANFPAFASDDFVRPLDARAPVLLTTHAMIGILAPALLLAGNFGSITWLRWPIWVLVGIGVLVTALCDDPRASGGALRAGGPGSNRWLRPVWTLFTGSRSVIWVCVSVAGLMVVVGGILPHRMDAARTRPQFTHGALGPHDLVTMLFWLAIALVGVSVILTSFAAFQRWCSQTTLADSNPWLGGFHCPIVAGIIVLLASTAGAAVTRIAAGVATTNPQPPPDNWFAKLWDWIVQSFSPGWLESSGFHLPDMYMGLTRVWGVAVIVIVVFGLGMGTSLWSRQAKRRRELDETPTVESITAEPATAESSVPTRVFAVASAKLETPRLLLFVAIALGCGVGAQKLEWVSRQSWLEILGILIPFILVGLLLRSIYNSVRNPRKEGRNLGVVWDLASFWPRNAHPLVPPAYAPRAIRDIEKFASGQLVSGERVILGGHSQGSLLMYAVAHRLRARSDQADSADDAPNPMSGWINSVSLLTYGSQLGWAYGRAFPGVLNLSDHARLRASLDGRWINLVRLTDYIGDGVTSRVLPGGLCRYDQDPAVPISQTGPPPIWLRDNIDSRIRLLEVWLPDPSGGDTPPNRLRQHSGYTSDPSWNYWISVLVGELAEDSQP